MTRPAPSTPRGEAFPKWIRLRRRPEFLQVASGGRKAVRRTLVVYALPRPDPALPTRAGFTASRRSVGKAVRRNRARRLLREAFRRAHASLAPGWDIVANTRHAAADASYASIRKDLLSCLRELGIAPPAETAPDRNPARE